MNDAMIGKTIGKYRIVEHLGRGGMAEVYKAYQPNLDRYVAVKMMHTFLSDEKEFLARFEREAKVVATLRHPNIVQVYDFDAEGGVYYMVMEYISGETLKTRMQTLEANNEWVALDDAARIILAVGSALKYAHERGMVHRDVKPANVMITLEGQVILTDFGIAKIVSASNLTASGAMVGTPSYMAPEQGMGQPGDERSDIYSLGVMLYQLVLGRLPFDADTPLAVVLKHINDPLPLPKALNPDISDDLNRVILKSLAKDPNDRYQKVADMTADLRRAMGMAPEDSHPDAAKSSAIKLAGATMVGRVGGGVTPLPRSAPAGTPQEQSGTQVAAPRTVVAGAATAPAAPPAVVPSPAVAAKRPGWIIPVALVAVLAIIGVGAMVVLNGQGNAAPTPAPTAIATTAAPTATTAPSATPTNAPLTTQAQQLQEDTELRDKAGSDASARIEGLLPAGAQFFVKARTADLAWVRIETLDGVTGWIDANATGLTADQLGQLPVATTLTRLTDTPTATVPPTDVPTATPTPTATQPVVPTRTRAPTQPPASPTAAAPAATPTTASSGIPLTLDWAVVGYDPLEPGNLNWTATVRLYASGGDGNFTYSAPNPDGGFDYQRGPDAFFTVRSRRCKTWLGEFRVTDGSGNIFAKSYAVEPPPGCTLP
jgi:serine/threonine-protein kinase